MVAMPPTEFIIQNRDNTIRKKSFNEKRNLHYSGNLTKDTYNKNKNSEYKNNFKPLRAADSNQNQLAFKGLKFKDLFPKSEIEKADVLLKRVKEIIDPKKNLGLYSLEDAITNTIDPLTKQNIAKSDVHVHTEIGHSFLEALSALPKTLARTAQKIFGGKEKKGQIELIEKKEKILNQLTGYYLEVDKHTRQFQDVFSGENLETVKGLLKNNKVKELEKFLEKKRLTPSLILGENNSNLGDLKSKLLDENNSQSLIEKLKINYIKDSINKAEDKKRGSYIPGFSMDDSKLVTRLVTGVITGGFIANDFYNLKMLTSNDKKEADKERKIRFTQQASYIGITAYLGYVLDATFKNVANRSLSFSVGLGFASAIGANIISRVFNKIPLLPKDPKEMDNKPYILSAAPLRKNLYYSSNINNNKEKSLSFTGWNYKEMMKASKNWLESMDKKAIKALPAKMSYNEFAESYKVLEKVDDGYAKDMLKTAGKYMGLTDNMPADKKLSLSDIENAAKNTNGQVIIGKNYLYDVGKSLINTVLFPFNLVIGLGKLITKPVLNMFGKEPETTKKSTVGNPELKVKNLVKWVKNATDKLKDNPNFNVNNMENASDDIIHQLKTRIGENPRTFHDTKVMDFGNDQLSTGMKFTGFASVPFLTIDAYNVSAEKTKNKHISTEKAKQRAIQDTTRQGISCWAVKSFNDVFKGLANYSLGGSALSSVLNCAGYELLTRLFVGQPVLTKTHEELKEIEKKRLKNRNWLSKTMGGKIKTDENNENTLILGSKTLRPDFFNMPVASNFFTTTINSNSINYAGFKEKLASPSGF
ncbi:MAG TPA: hypothetical protein P5556_05555 [Candidatus Gastranaerophilales bacterium]|nr:hypothetical protein [Candidatus Gastranaerophilales bacterium]